MKRMGYKIAAIVMIALLTAWSASAMEDHDKHSGHGGDAKMEMDHGKMEGTFMHKTEVDGIRFEFQVMSLASMNMNDPHGATHHIMVKMIHADHDMQIKEAVGKIKVIGPDGKEQEAAVKNYGGVFAANFTFDKPGKYGVISLFKIDDKKHVAKFWYPHHE